MTDETAAPRAAGQANDLGPKADRDARIQHSPNYGDGQFQNPVPTEIAPSGTMWKIIRKQFGGGEDRMPRRSPPIVQLTRASFDVAPPSGLRVTWLGHSTTLIEIDDAKILVDPVFSKRVSPTQLAGPSRFHAPPLPLHELPALDAVILTHDHYDHLDKPVMRFFASSADHRSTRFIASLGVGAHLERWGMNASRITELDWNESARVGATTITATPARHFSGRTLRRNRTLWSSWVIAGPRHRVFHTGDSGFFEGIADIGAAHGPFDLNLINIGAYADEWPDIHLFPEQAIPMHRMLGGPLLLPIHWGTFNLAFHPWTEPVERLLTAAAAAEVRLVTPRAGEPVDPAAPRPVETWWRTV